MELGFLFTQLGDGDFVGADLFLQLLLVLTVALGGWGASAYLRQLTLTQTLEHASPPDPVGCFAMRGGPSPHIVLRLPGPIDQRGDLSLP